ncbi:MAG: hypothetical protein QOH96_968 [Blastocatellia bacterium]|nr:hypothetical protein [Blastocatellia bacterium]
MSFKKTASVLLSFFFCLNVVGQTPPVRQPAKADDDEVVRITTNLVQVDAVVTDKKGSLVTDLKPEEFQIFEDGKPRQISNFSLVLLPGQSAPQPGKSALAIDRNAPGVPPVLLRPEQVRRTIALVVDDLGLSFESTHQVREALKKYVDQQMLPGDLVAIIRTSGGIGALQQFTTDKRQLYAAIEKIRWYPNGRGGVAAFAPISSSSISSSSSASPLGNAEGDDGSDDPQAALEEFRQNVFAVGTLGALQYVIRGLERLPGRKAVVLFSDGLAITNKSNNGSTDRTKDAMDRLVQEANRSSVVVYTLDAKGLVYTGITAADDLSGMTAAQINDPQNGPLASRNDSLFRGQEGLNFLARETGGIPIRNSNDLSGGLRKIMEDQKGYYLVGYRPDASTFDRKTGKPAFHRLTIRVTRPGLEIRSRRGFYGVTDQPVRPMGGTRNEQLLAALTSPFGESGVNVRLTSLFGNDAKEGSFVRSLLHVKGSDLTFTDEPDGWKKVVFDVLAVTYGDNGNLVEQIGRTETVRVSPNYFKLINEKGFDYVFLVPIKKPGAYQFRTAFRDTVSEHLGSASQFVEVPDLKKNRLSLSGIVMNGFEEKAAKSKSTALAGSENATAKSGVASTTNATAAEGTAIQTTPSTPQPEKYVDNQTTGPAVRKFKPGMIMAFVYFIYNARLDKATNRPELYSQVRIFKDGQPFFTGNLNPVPASNENDPKHIAAGTRIQLPDGMLPGDYVLQIVATDKIAGEKNRTATTWIDFEVVR